MAEYGWALSEDTKCKARKELNEYPENKQSNIKAMHQQIHMRPDITFLRTDDAFLIRFLRARKHNIYEAFQLLVRYFQYRVHNETLFKKFYATETGIKASLMDGFPGVLDQRDKFGRKILVLFSSNWDNRSYGLASIFRAILLTLEKLIEDEETQVNGFVMVIEWSEFSFKQSTWIQPKILKLMIEGLQDCFPARFGAIHFVNQPWYVEAVFKVMKPFVKDKTKDKLYMHGNNMATLYHHIDKEYLPAELGGSQPPFNLQAWAHQLIGDESFSFGEKHIYWPEHCSVIKTRSETFPMDQYTTEIKTEKKQSSKLDGEFFSMD